MHGVGHCHLETYKVCQENIWQPLAINCHPRVLCIENWRNLIFSDEMSIIVSGNGLIKVWRKRTEGFLPECIGYLKQHEDRNLKVMVWGY
jgi:hypothetical protein